MEQVENKCDFSGVLSDLEGKGGNWPFQGRKNQKGKKKMFSLTLQMSRGSVWTGEQRDKCGELWEEICSNPSFAFYFV